MQDPPVPSCELSGEGHSKEGGGGTHRGHKKETEFSSSWEEENLQNFRCEKNPRHFVELRAVGSRSEEFDKDGTSCA